MHRWCSRQHRMRSRTCRRCRPTGGAPIGRGATPGPHGRCWKASSPCPSPLTWPPWACRRALFRVCRCGRGSSTALRPSCASPRRWQARMYMYICTCTCTCTYSRITPQVASTPPFGQGRVYGWRSSVVRKKASARRLEGDEPSNVARVRYSISLDSTTMASMQTVICPLGSGFRV